MFGRNLNWFSQSPDGKLWHPESDAGGGAGDWPDYEMPDLGGSGGGGDQSQSITQPAAPAQAGQPGTPAAQPAGGASGDRGDGQPGQRPAAGTQPQPAAQPGQRRADLPEYRQQQIAAREEQRINTLVQQGVRDALQRAFAPQEPGQQADPRQERLRETIFGLVPGLKELVEKQQQILQAAESGQQWTESNKVYWQGVAVRTLSSVHDGAAAALLGAGKAGKDLDEETRNDVQSLFIRWVDGDRTGQRVNRYESQDPTLVREFLTAWTARYIDPVRRSAAVTAGQRGQQRAQVPTAGPGAMPPAAKPPEQNNMDEDAVHGRGWATVQQLRGAQ
jgi:hypothetical protein